MKLSEPQSLVAKSKARFKLFCSGRRSGKTTLAIRELCYHAKEPNSVCWALTSSYRSAKSLFWEPLKAQLSQLKWIKKINEAELTILLKNGSKIQVRGADNKDSLRGHYIKGICCIDEAQDIDPEILTVVRPMLSDYKAKLLITGTPKGRSNHFFDWYQRGQDETETEWQSWQFTTAQSGFVDQDELEQARKDLDPRTYAQEYEAEFANYEGVVYYSFDRAKHVKQITFDRPQQIIHVSVDFNINPMTAVCFVYDNGHFYYIDEIEMHGSNTDELCQEILKRFPNAKIFAYPDASAKARKTSAGGRTDVSIMQNNGFIVKMFNKNPSIRDRINAVNTQLCNGDGQTTIQIHPKCKKLIQSLERQIYKPGTSIPEKDTGWDHMNDAFGYGISFLKPIRRHYEQTEQPQQWKVKVA